MLRFFVRAVPTERVEREEAANLVKHLRNAAQKKNACTPVVTRRVPCAEELFLVGSHIAQRIAASVPWL